MPDGLKPANTLVSQRQEVGDKLFAISSQDAFRVELNPFDGHLPMPQAHDDSGSVCIFTAGGDFELFWQAFFLHDQRVVTGGCHRRRDVAKQCAPVMDYLASFAVHQVRRSYDFAAERLTDGLMSEADAEDGDFSCHDANEFDADAGFAWSAGARRDDDLGRC